MNMNMNTYMMRTVLMTMDMMIKKVETEVKRNLKKLWERWV